MSQSTIFTLPPISAPPSRSRSSEASVAASDSDSESRSETGPNDSMKDQIESALLGTGEVSVPGSTEDDEAWAYKRSVPTVVLYDERGLRLYDQITSHATEYYLFPDELNLLKTHGEEIARGMGFPGRRQFQTAQKNLDSVKGNDKERKQENGREEDGDEREERDEIPEKNWKPARWGDQAVGKYNGGVNGEEGLGGGWKTGWDVVELGAGALRKTAYLLTALSSALPPAPADTNASTSPTAAPITYHPLDLSYPELDRVLGEMQQEFGEQLKGKVHCIGLHGDYEAGLQFIREGKLASLRQDKGPGLEENESPQERSVSPVPAREGMAIPTSVQTKYNNVKQEESPILSPESLQILTPLSDPSPLPSAITDSDVSCGGDGVNSGTWTPLSDSDRHSNNSDSENPHRQSVKPFLHDFKRAGSPLSKLPAGQGQRQQTAERPLHFVFLGSSLGNFDRESAAPFLRSLPLKKGDTLLIGLDGRPSPGPEGRKKVEVAYNDPAGYTRAFEEHGWEVVREQLGLKGDAGVEFVGRYNEVLGRHEAYFKSKAQQTLHLPNCQQDITLEKDELLNIEWSYKYSYAEAIRLFDSAHLRIVNTWKAPDSEYRLWLLERPSVRFFTEPIASLDTIATTSTGEEKQDEMIATLDIQDVEDSNDKMVDLTTKYEGVPTWEQWLDLWKFWDHITLEMIPKEMLHKKPIDLRHICLFYLGHIPTFLDIHLTRMTKGSHTEPEYFKTIFERGIDPDVDDPTKCHDHSEVPMSEEDWPALPEILAFRDRVRARLRGIYDRLSAPSGSSSMAFSRHVGRVLFMSYEHEAMHAETLLYMLAQSDETRHPTAVATPQFDILSRQWQENRAKNEVLAIKGSEIKLGHRDLESEDKDFPDKEGWRSHKFGWDNEHPEFVQKIKTFKVDSLPITNDDYLSFLKASGKFTGLNKDNSPASWVQIHGQWRVRSFYGPQTFEVAGQWPLMASKLELDNFAKSKGGRLPTEAELRALWTSEEGPRVSGGDRNIGVKNWHPVPPTNTHTDNAGKVIHGHNGGVWEWTSTPFAGYEGFVPSVIYPGYSGDFYDTKHFVVIGASWATIPNIASRRSFRNWYQANYRFSFIGGRVAYDI